MKKKRTNQKSRYVLAYVPELCCRRHVRKFGYAKPIDVSGGSVYLSVGDAANRTYISGRLTNGVFVANDATKYKGYSPSNISDKRKISTLTEIMIYGNILPVERIDEENGRYTYAGRDYDVKFKKGTNRVLEYVSPVGTIRFKKEFIE